MNFKKFLPIFAVLMLMILSMGAVSAADVSNQQVGVASGQVKKYVETEASLPSAVTVGSENVTSPQFLYLLTKSTTNVNSGISSSIAIKNLAVPSKPSESVKSGTLTKSQYITLANSINQFINTNGRLPNFANTNLGTMRYETLTYTYSSIMNFYNTNKRLPNYVSITPWSETLGWTQLSYTYHHQTTEYTCGPSALKMAFSHYNLSLSESYLANVGGSDYYTGTSQNGMIAAVNAVNNKYDTNYSMTMESFTGWNSIQSYLANGVPVIIKIRSFLETYGTHYVMISGINMQTGRVRLGDPSYNDGKPFSIKDKGVKIHEVSMQDLQDRLYWVINNKDISKPLMPLVKK